MAQYYFADNVIEKRVKRATAVNTSVVNIGAPFNQQSCDIVVG